MEDKKEETNYFKNQTIYNNALIELFEKTLEMNKQIISVIQEQKKMLEEAKKNGSPTR